MRMDTTALVVGAVASAAVIGLLGGRLAYSGQLDPPAGPVTPTSPSLGDLAAQLAALQSAEGDVGLAGTDATPGSATDGKPLPLRELRGRGWRVEVYKEPGQILFVDEFSIVDLGRSVEVITFMDGGDGSLRARPGRENLPEVTLIRSFDPDRDFEEWHQDNAQGQVIRREAALIGTDARGFEVARWRLFECWPSAMDVRMIDGEMVEQITLVVERCERE